MQIQIDARDYLDARSACGRLLSEAAFGDGPAPDACRAAGANLATISSWRRASGVRSHIPAN